jgi:hypothetical protein
MNGNLIFHFGGPKTGSSALQNFFLKNKELLLAQGIFYRRSSYEVGEVNSGNGSDLYFLLTSEASTNKELDDLILSYLSPNDDAISICSSELFSFLETSDIYRIVESCLRQNVTYSIAYYVRSPLEYCISNYNQLVKRHGECRSLEQYLSTARWDHYAALKRLDELIPARNLLIRYYDKEVAGNIVKDFLAAIGYVLTLDDIDNPKKINRSFSKSELSLMLSLNSILGPNYSQSISDLILNTAKSPEKKDLPVISKNTIHLIEQRFSDEIKWVNSKFFWHTATFIDPEIGFSGAAEESVSTIAANSSSIEKTLLLWAANQLATAEELFLNNTRNAVLALAADRALENDPGIPHDFDPITYLILNIDLIKDKANPYFHYLNFGKQEGRQYKI